MGLFAAIRDIKRIVTDYSITKFQTEIGTAQLRIVRRYSEAEMAAVGAFTPQKGMTVNIFNGWGKKLFGGFASKITWRPLTGSKLDKPAREFNVQCTDYTRILDEHVAFANYDNIAAGVIIRDLIYTLEYRPGSGFNLDESQGMKIAQVSDVVDGPLLSIVFDGDPVSRAIDRIVELSNTSLVQYGWWVGVDRDVHFIPLDPILAPVAKWSLADPNSMLWNSLSVEETEEKYANQVFVQVSVDAVTPVDDTFVGNGVATTFDVALPIEKVTRIVLSSVEQTFAIGPEGSNPGFDWYYTRGSVTITQAAGGLVLTSGDTLVVSSIPMFTNIAEAVDTTEQAARAVIEGGSGRKQVIIQDDTIATLSAGQALADAILARSVKPAAKIEFQTFKPNESYDYDVDPGMIIRGDPTDLLVLPVTPFMVDQVQIDSTEGGNSPESRALVYTIRASGGALLGNYIDFFRSLARGGGGGGGSVGAYDEGFWHIPGLLTIGRNGTVHHQFSRNCSPVFAFASLLAGTVAPASTIIDFIHRPSGASILGATKIVIPAGQTDSTEPVSFSMSTFTSREKAELNVTQTGGARNCVVYLFSV